MFHKCYAIWFKKEGCYLCAVQIQPTGKRYIYVYVYIHTYQWEVQINQSHAYKRTKVLKQTIPISAGLRMSI